jgi:hypothetical protein
VYKRAVQSCLSGGNFAEEYTEALHFAEESLGFGRDALSIIRERGKQDHCRATNMLIIMCNSQQIGATIAMPRLNSYKLVFLICLF